MQEVLEILKNKHESGFTPMQLRIWGEMIAGGLHSSTDDPPQTSMFSRAGGKAIQKKSSQVVTFEQSMFRRMNVLAASFLKAPPPLHTAFSVAFDIVVRVELVGGCTAPCANRAQTPGGKVASCSGRIAANCVIKTFRDCPEFAMESCTWLLKLSYMYSWRQVQYVMYATSVRTLRRLATPVIYSTHA